MKASKKGNSYKETCRRSSSAGKQDRKTSTSPLSNKMDLVTELKLSTVIESKKPGIVLEPHKLSVVEKYITVVDQIPEQYKTAETVFLSNNCISSLYGLKQFRNIKTLSIANNCITSFSELDHLSELSQLKLANLEFNPISQLPYYRYHVIARVPQIRILDNREITAQERAKAVPITKKEEATLDLMFNNECLIAKLSKGIEIMRNDENLRSRILKKIQTLYSRSPGKRIKLLDSGTIFSIWEMQDVLTEEDRDCVNDLLRKEVRKIYNIRSFGGGMLREVRGKSSDPWETCYSEVLLHQQTRIAELLYELEKESNSILKLMHDDNLAVDDFTSTRDRERIVEELRQSMNVMIEVIKRDFDVERKGGQEKKDVKKKYSDERRNENIQEHDPFGPISYATTLVHSLPPKQKDPAIPQQGKTENVSISEKKPSLQKKFHPSAQTEKAEPSSSNNISAISYTSKESLDSTEVELLTSRESHLHQEQQNALHRINLQLKTKLEQFKSRNVENVRKAEQERERLESEIEILRSRLRDSEKKISHYTGEVEHLRLEQETKMQSDNNDVKKLTEELKQSMQNERELEIALNQVKHETVKANSEVKYLKEIAEEYGNELKELFVFEHKVEKAECYDVKRLMRKGYRMLKYATVISQTMDKIQKRFSELNDKRTLTDCLKLWYKKRTCLKLYRRQRYRCISEFIMRWREATILRKNAKALMTSCKSTTLKHCFKLWRQSLTNIQEKSEIFKKADKLFIYRLLSKYFKIWQECWSYESWQHEKLEDRVRRYKNILTMRKIMRTWRKHAKLVSDKRYQFAQLSLFRLKVATFSFWKDLAVQEKKNKIDTWNADNSYRLTMLVKFIHKWENAVQQKRRLRQLVRKSDRIHDRWIVKRCFFAWKKLFFSNLNRRLLYAKTFDHYFKYLYRKHFNSWKEFVKNNKERKLTYKLAYRKRLSSLFLRWKNQLSEQRRIKSLEVTASIMRSDREKRQAIRLLKAWRQLTLTEGHLNMIASVFQKRWTRCIIRNYFWIWLNHLWNTRKDFVGNLTTEIQILKTSIEDKSERIADADRENLQSVKSLHEMTADLAQYRLRLNEREQEISKLKSSIEASDLVERSLRKEIESLNTIEDKHQHEVKMLLSRITEQENKIELMVAQLRTSEGTITSLIQKGHKQQTELERTEQTLSAAYRDVQTKLASALDLISSLRTMMEEKDRKHALELDSLKQRMIIESKESMTSFTKHAFEADLLQDNERENNAIIQAGVKGANRQGEGQSGYVKFEEETQVNIFSRPEPETVSVSSVCSSDSSVDSSVIFGASQIRNSELDDQITRLQQEIAKRLSARQNIQ